MIFIEIIKSFRYIIVNVEKNQSTRQKITNILNGQISFETIHYINSSILKCSKIIPNLSKETYFVPRAVPTTAVESLWMV